MKERNLAAEVMALRTLLIMLLTELGNRDIDLYQSVLSHFDEEFIIEGLRKNNIHEEDISAIMDAQRSLISLLPKVERFD